VAVERRRLPVEHHWQTVVSLQDPDGFEPLLSRMATRKWALSMRCSAPARSRGDLCVEDVQPRSNRWAWVHFTGAALQMWLAATAARMTPAAASSRSPATS